MVVEQQPVPERSDTDPATGTGTGTGTDEATSPTTPTTSAPDGTDLGSDGTAPLAGGYGDEAISIADGAENNPETD